LPLASGSCGFEYRGDLVGKRLAIFEAIGDNAERKRLYLGVGLGLSLAIGEHARKCRHFGNPPAVFLTLTFDLQHFGSTGLLYRLGSL
jgi:hypothetical protein